MDPSPSRSPRSLGAEFIYTEQAEARKWTDNPRWVEAVMKDNARREDAAIKRNAAWGDAAFEKEK